MTPIRPELPREFVAGHKRRRMMDAIAELTADAGYEATKIADIVRRAAVARKTLYDNFDGKEDLFLSAVDSIVTEMRVLVEEACDDGDDPEERIVAGLEAMLDFIAEHPAASLVGGVAWILQLQIRRGEAETAPGLLPELSQFVLSPYLGVGKVVNTGRRK